MHFLHLFCHYKKFHFLLKTQDISLKIISPLALKIEVRHIVATMRAFSALKGDGTIVCWGDVAWGGGDEDVWGQLRNVQRLAANGCAFAAVLEDGVVVTWGDPLRGGWGRVIREVLKDEPQDINENLC